MVVRVNLKCLLVLSLLLPASLNALAEAHDCDKLAVKKINMKLYSKILVLMLLGSLVPVNSAKAGCEIRAVHCMRYRDVLGGVKLDQETKSCTVSLIVPPPLWEHLGESNPNPNLPVWYSKSYIGERIDITDIKGGCPGAIAGSKDAVWGVLIRYCLTPKDDKVKMFSLESMDYIRTQRRTNLLPDRSNDSLGCYQHPW